MPLVTRKRIKHLARYFGVLAMALLVSYDLTLHPVLLFFLSPGFFLAYWFRVKGGVLTAWIPQTHAIDQFALFFPLTLIYFGLIGFQLKNLINERGKLRVISTFIFLAFLSYIHWTAFKELNRYLEGSTPAEGVNLLSPHLESLRRGPLEKVFDRLKLPEASPQK